MKRRTRLASLLALAAFSAASATAQDQDVAPATGEGPAARIGIVLPEAQLGQGNTGRDVGEPVRQLIISYMTGPRLELVPLQAKVAAQVSAEAEQQRCTHVLYTSVAQKKASKGMGSMLGMLAPAAAMLPGLGAMGGQASMIAGVAAQTMTQAAAQSAQQEAIASLTQAQSGSVKARDEISLSYQFVAVADGQPLLEETLKAKAKENGEDLLRPLVEQVAEKTVIAALTPRS
ncbi:MAG TPA: hypothetical protein VFM30_09420 [Steroidobacteraceae bacterium]|nr:hypothetical protein [Steroidobacteraceae bacterium]